MHYDPRFSGRPRLVANDGHERDIGEVSQFASRANGGMLERNPSLSSGGDKNMGSSAKYLEQMKQERRLQGNKIALPRGDPAAALMAISESEANQLE